MGDITGHSKVGVLIDGGRDQTREVTLAENMRECVRKCRNCLNRRECKLSNIVFGLESKDALNLGVVDVFLDADNILVHVADVLNI